LRDARPRLACDSELHPAGQAQGAGVVFTPTGVPSHSPGSRKRTLGLLSTWRFLPRRGWINGTLARCCNPFGVEKPRVRSVPGCANATLGCEMEPLRGKNVGAAESTLKPLLHSGKILVPGGPEAAVAKGIVEQIQGFQQMPQLLDAFLLARPIVV
jgi:hypothetical protein